MLQVILYCADIGLLHHDLLPQSVITSVGIQQRYSEATVMNKVNKFQYWLLENNFDQAAFKSVPRNRVSVTETPVSAAITEVYASEIPQKKSK